ncbi:DHA2 family efflux MFS transporter permease subunit [Periweissella cryptocerci]|uniref:DHA2 family efflux MFS transporter permease subunit n=1 Tax=Periweissella cryptocerci TaxID=2506420 RepID=A0A4P6YTY3_9LACO|nr:MDR family MFS transporter [Periweissella cryptocerci]QBO36170.1 DHA2 family efflux MFS transporter permease subunit [Periweissella cryptocerci]
MTQQTTQTKQAAIPKPLLTIAWILVLGSMAPMLDSTMVNIAVNTLSVDFHTKLAVVQWTITGFALAMGGAIPFSGWLVNRFSGKLVYLWAEVAFGITSLMAGMAWNIDSLIVFRLLQGFAAGLIMPLLTTLLVDAVGGDKMGRVMAIVGVPMTLGPMLGPIIGGIIVQSSSWRWIFFINVPIVIIASILMIKKVPAIAPKNREAKFDGLGVFLLAAISGMIVYGVVQASNYGNFTNRDTLSYIGAGVVLLVVYIIYAIIRKDKATLPLHLFKYRNFTGSMVGLFLAGFITSGPMILLPLFFQDVRGASVVIAAIALIPQSVGMLISRGIIGRMIDSIGARWVVIIGVLIDIVGTLPFVYFDAKSAYWLIGIIMFIRGIGGAAVVSALMADAFVGIPKADSASASMGTRMLQQVGGGFGAALLSTVVAGYISTHHVTQATQLAGAYQQGFLWSTILVLIILIPAFMLTNKIKLK